MWKADKLGYKGNTNYNRAYEGDELVWEKQQPGPTPAGNQIWYTTTDGNIISGGAGVVSNVYIDGKGIITYDTIITKTRLRQFAYKTTLSTMTFPDTFTRLGESTFAGCSSLEYVYFSESLISIGADAFVNSRLSRIDLPHSLEIIYDRGFRGSDYLRNITYNGTIEEWGNVSKGTNWHDGVPATVVHCTDGDVAI